MSQRAVEVALGRLACDAAFRQRFRDNAEAAILAAGLDVTMTELVCLVNIRFQAVKTLAAHVEQRMRRAGLASENGAKGAVQKRRAV